MKTTSILFWIMMIAMAIFYIEIGNDMHKERKAVLKATLTDNNTTQ